MTHSIAPLVAAAAILLAGCASAPSGPSEEEKAEFMADKPSQLQPLFLPIITAPEADRVSHQLRAGLAAMEEGHNNLAGATFDDALLTIETVYGGDKKAEKARGKYNKESSKVFRGEPYERAMAYYYRGILYLMEDDYENARASFKSGFLQDSMAGAEEFQEDFALLAFLEGWASQCNGDTELATEAYALARKHNGELTLPAARDNTLVLADLGHAPTKYTEGEYDEYLKIKAQDQVPTPETGGTTRWQNRATASARPLPNSESIARQATTRGGREFDRILANKVEYKEAAESSAEVLGVVGQVLSTQSNVSSALGDYDSALSSAGLGLMFSLFSAAEQASADATKPEADTRQWWNLPEEVAYGAFAVDELSRPTVSFSAGVSSSAVNYTTGEPCSVVWARSRSAH